MSRSDVNFQEGVLVLPRLRVQNANAISSPMTWGFPSITAFVGLMHSLARRLSGSGIEFRGVGVICHDYEAQVTEGGYTRAFQLTRNPVDDTGATASIVEEGRIHLDLTLILLVNVAEIHWSETAREQQAAVVRRMVGEMRIAGGSVFPHSPPNGRSSPRPLLKLLPSDAAERRAHFRRLLSRWLPGFALVARDDVLHQHLIALKKVHPESSLLEAWLDLSRWNHRAIRTIDLDSATGESRESVEWVTDQREGWTVPIPVGYAGISELYAAGNVVNARDETTSFRFVESAYSIGQWISPHRLADVNDLLWYSEYDDSNRLYRCRNDFSVKLSTDIASGNLDDPLSIQEN